MLKRYRINSTNRKRNLKKNYNRLLKVRKAVKKIKVHPSCRNNQVSSAKTWMLEIALDRVASISQTTEEEEA